MFPTPDSQFQSDMYANIPTMALAFTMYTATFGNGSFVIQPPMPNQVGDDFPSVPYLSLEALLYEQQASNPMSAPFTTLAGANSGQQVVSSTQTFNDATGTPRALSGVQQTG